jgi:hypothetical protein
MTSIVYGVKRLFHIGMAERDHRKEARPGLFPDSSSTNAHQELRRNLR